MIFELLEIAEEVTNKPSPHFISTVKSPIIIGLSVQGDDDTGLHRLS